MPPTLYNTKTESIDLYGTSIFKKFNVFRKICFLVGAFCLKMSPTITVTSFLVGHDACEQGGCFTSGRLSVRCLPRTEYLCKSWSRFSALCDFFREKSIWIKKRFSTSQVAPWYIFATLEVMKLS